MKKLLSPAAGHAVCLAVVLMICSVALIVIKAFLPAFILPRITITLLVMLSLVALAAEHFLFGSDGTTQYLETGLLAAAAFWMAASRPLCRSHRRSAMVLLVPGRRIMSGCPRSRRLST